MNLFPVSEKKNIALSQDMMRLGIKESDLQESFVRSGGAGGQNVNKVSSCVMIKHIPSGIIVKCQSDRSQAINRFLARRILVDKLQAQRTGEQSAQASLISKIRRQKRKRSKRAKEKMLDTKSKHGQKKEHRRHISRNDW